MVLLKLDTDIKGFILSQFRAQWGAEALKFMEGYTETWKVAYKLRKVYKKRCKKSGNVNVDMVSYLRVMLELSVVCKMKQLSRSGPGQHASARRRR